MATFGVWKNGFFGVGGVNLSDHAREITVNTSVAMLPNDAHGDNVLKQAAGLEDWSIEVVLLQDFALTKVDATFASIGGVGHTPFSIEVGADASSVSTTNPRFSGVAVLAEYKPLGGEHGVNLQARATFRPASQLTRRTT